MLKGYEDYVPDGYTSKKIKMLENKGTVECWETFAWQLNHIINNTIQVGKVNPNVGTKLSYINRDTKLKLTHTHNLWNKYLHCKSTSNYEKSKQQGMKQHNYAIKYAKYDYENYLAPKINTNRKLFWNYVRPTSKQNQIYVS